MIDGRSSWSGVGSDEACVLEDWADIATDSGVKWIASRLGHLGYISYCISILL